MKYLNASLLLFFLVSTIDAEKKNLTSDESSLYEYDENSEKNSEKRWLGENQPKAVLAEPSPFVPNKYARSEVETDKSGQERAKEEKTLRDFVPYDAIQNALINVLKPRPIVDTADESEKNAPNNGNAADILGDLIIKGTETISRALNSVMDVPKKAFNKLSASASQALNQLGAYIVGL